MQELWKILPSPRHLSVFEAAGRLGSFTAAAQELNVQQPAVSAAIRQLEEAMGVLLFNRTHRKVMLTDAGRRLHVDVTRAFEDVLRSVRQVRQYGRSDHVTLNASSAFAYYWMMPRLQELHRDHPQIDLRLQSSDHEPDIDAENISLAVRRGQGDWPDVHAAKIADEVIFPIASPLVMASARNLRTVPNLLHERLIHLEEPIRERPTWRQWFAHHDVHNREPVAGLRLNDYALVLQAAIAGEGFAFGWQHVTRGLIRQGLLAARPEWAWRTGAGFYLVWSRARPLIPQAAAVRDWIIAQAKVEMEEIARESGAPV